GSSPAHSGVGPDPGQPLTAAEGSSPAHSGVGPDPGQPLTAAAEARGVSVWLHALDHLAIFVTVVGLLFFGVLSWLYDHFYKAFGVSTPSMGIGYTDTLIGSWGFIALVLITGGIVTPLLYWPLFVTNRRRSLFPRLPWPFMLPGEPEVDDSKKWERSRRVWLCTSLVVAFVEIVGISLFFLVGAVNDSAITAKRGEFVEPIRFLGWLILDVHAHRVTDIAPVSDISPASVPAGTFMYLGNSDRSYTLYNISNKRIVRLSTERFVLTTLP
ncbi:hypothetical protein OV450_7609, partial [Actinobacteria bacterium OV450]